MNDPTLKYREQHKQRLSYMPWLYWTLKPAQRKWAQSWQQEIQQYLCDMETVTIEGDCFISPDAKLFAERGRPIIIRDKSFIAADTVLHGPIDIGQHVGINHHVTIDGNRKGVQIGNHCRIAAYSTLIAFNHRIDASQPVHLQGVSSEGIQLEPDVWLGAHSAVTDGVTIQQGAVVGMRSVVTKDVSAYTVVAGNPARPIKKRS